MIGLAIVGRLAEPAAFVVQYREKAGILLLSKIAAIYNLVAILALVPIAGVYGAAIATGSAQIMKALYLWWHVRDIARWANFRAALTMTALIWGSCIAVCLAMKSVLAAPPLVHLIIGALVCGLATFLYARSPALAPSDRQILASVLHGREARVLEWLGILRKAPAT